MRWIWLALAVTAVASLLWLAGETHRATCVEARRVACSLLPWDDGRPRPAAAPSGFGGAGGGFGDGGFGP